MFNIINNNNNNKAKIEYFGNQKRSKVVHENKHSFSPRIISSLQYNNKNNKLVTQVAFLEL